MCASVVGDRPANGVAAEGCVTKQAKGKVWKHLGSSDAQLMPSRASSTVTIPAGNSPPPIFEFCIFFFQIIFFKRNQISVSNRYNISLLSLCVIALSSKCAKICKSAIFKSAHWTWGEIIEISVTTFSPARR